MAFLFIASSYSVPSSSSSFVLKRNPPFIFSPLSKHPISPRRTHLPFSLSSRPRSIHPLRSANKDDPEGQSPSSSSVAVVSEKQDDSEGAGKSGLGEEGNQSGEREKQQEMDWKMDEEFKNFMGNPSIEAAIKLEKKRADRKLKELDRENSDNPLVGLFNRLVRDSVAREKERLEKAEEAFKALDLNKVTPRNYSVFQYLYTHYLILTGS